jgi:tetratricopeptide (TPR) repeat protein
MKQHYFIRNFLLLAIFWLPYASAGQGLYDRYVDFSAEVAYNNSENALRIAQTILPEAASLSPQQQQLFHYKLAGIYEGLGEQEKAIEQYEWVARAVPDYYVPHLALGYLYVDRSGKTGDPALLRKALPHLERAMACDPNAKLKKLIRKTYSKLKDDGFSGLENRLEQWRGTCITVLVE